MPMMNPSSDIVVSAKTPSAAHRLPSSVSCQGAWLAGGMLWLSRKRNPVKPAGKFESSVTEARSCPVSNRMSPLACSTT